MFHEGDHIGPYALLQKLGRGSFGEVWLAEEKTAISSHRAALKLPNEDDVDLEAIRQEADVWESVKGHPNILPIIKADIFEGQIYIASEYAPGGSLSEWLKEHDGKAPTIETAIRMISGILAGLEHLHSKGVIHRDLKPANILLQSDTPRIADFGIARLIKSTTTTANSTLSAGTPSYMAPECFYGIRSEQTDVWAAGVLFDKLLTGELPFSQPDQVSVMNAVLNAEPQINENIPEEIRQIIRKALQKDPARRYQTAAEMRADLTAINLTVIEAKEKSTAKLSAVITAPKESDREEETIVNTESQPSVVYIRRAGTPLWQKLLPVGVGLFLILAAITAWSAFNSGQTAAPANTQTTYINPANESNTNKTLKPANSTTGLPNSVISTTENKPIEHKKISNSTETNSEPEASPSPEESRPNENANRSRPTATPLEIAPEVTPIPRPGRTTKTPTPSNKDDEDAPPPTAPAKTPTPIDVDAAPPRPRVSKPTPNPSEKPNDEPPVMKNPRLN